MLDNIDVEGLGALNTMTGWLLGSAIVILVAGLAIGGAIVGSGKSTNNPDRFTKGFATMGVAVVGAVLHGGIGPAVAWGMDRGNESLMPEAAGPGNVTVEQDAAYVSCDIVTVNFVDDDSFENFEQAHDWTVDLVGEEASRESEALAWDDSFFSTNNTVDEVQWIPDGGEGDCSPENKTVTECTDVEISYTETSALPGGTDPFASETLSIG